MIVAKEAIDRLRVDLAVLAVNLLGDFRAPLTDPPGDLRVEGLAVESMTQDGLAVGLLCSVLLDRDYFFALNLGAASGHQYAKNASGIHSKGN